MFHFIAIFLMMVPLGVIENHESLEWSSFRHALGILGWARNASSNIPQRLKIYTRFPETVIGIATPEIRGLSIAGPIVLQIDATRTIAMHMNALRLGKSRPEQPLFELSENEIAR